MLRRSRTATAGPARGSRHCGTLPDFSWIGSGAARPNNLATFPKSSGLTTLDPVVQGHFARRLHAMEADAMRRGMGLLRRGAACAPKMIRAIPAMLRHFWRDTTVGLDALIVNRKA